MMKNLFSKLALLVLMVFGAGSINAQTFVYSQAFIGGATPTTQCTAWATFCSSLPSSGISGFTVSSSISGTVYTCTSPCAAQAVANGMRTATAVTTSSDGHTWFVGISCGTGGCQGVSSVELAVDQGTCACGSIFSVRPSIANSNWGGMGTTCTAPSQTITVTFITGSTWYSNVGGGDATNLNNWWSNNNNTGSHPANFTTLGDNWVFQSAMTTSTSPFTISGNVKIASAGSFTAPNGTLNVGGSWNNLGAFVNNSGTVVFTNAVGCATTYTISGALVGANKFNNVTFSSPGNTYVFSNPADVAGSFNITSGTITAPTGELQISGNYSNSGSFQNNGGTVVMSPTAAGTYTLLGNMTGANRFNNLTFNGTTGSTFFNFGSTATDVAGNFTIASGNVTAPVGTTLNVGGNWTNNGAFTASTGTVQMFQANAGTYSLSGSMTGTNKFNNLNFTGASNTWAFMNSADLGGSLNILSGNITAPSTTLQVAGNWSNLGTFNNNNGTVNMNGSGTLAGNMTGTSNRFNNLLFAGTYSFSNNADIAGNFIINSGTVTALSSGTLNVGGNWNNLGSFNANNGTVVMNGTGTFTISGNMTGSPFSRFNNLTFNNAGGNWAFGSSADVGGNFTITSAANVTAPSGTLQVFGSWANNGGRFDNNGGTVLMANSGTLSSSGTGTLTGSNKFNNLTFSGSSWTFLSNAEAAGTFTINSGIVTAPTGTLSVGGNWINNSSFNANGGTVVMNGSGTGMTLNGNMTGTPFSRFNNLTFNNGGSWIFNNAAEVGGNFSIISGAVTAPASSLTVFGSWLNNANFLNNNGTVNMSGTAGGLTLNGNMTGVNKFNVLNFNGSGSWSFGSNAAEVASTFNQSGGTLTAPSTTLTVGGNWSHTGGTYTHNNGSVIMNSGSSATISTLMTSPSRFYNLTFNGASSSNFTFLGATEIANNFTNTNGNAIAPGGNTLSVGGNWSNLSSFNANGGTVQMFNGGTTGSYTMGGNMTGTNKFNVLTFNGSGNTWSFGSTAADVASTFTIGSGTTVVAPSSMLQVAGSWSNSGTFSNNGGTVNMNATTGTFTLSGSMTGTTNRFNQLIFNGVGGSWQFNNAADIAGNLTMTNGNVNASPAGTINVLGNWSTAAGGTFTAPSALNVGGNWSNLGTFNNSNSTVTMNGTGAYTISGSLTGGNRFYNLLYNNSGGDWTFSSSAAEVAGVFTINAGAVTAPASTLTLSSTLSAGQFNNNGGVFRHNGGTVLVNGGNLTFNISGIGTMVTTNRFNHLTFSGCNTYTFNASADMAGNFLNSCGNVVTNANTLTVGGNWTNNSTFTNGSGSVVMNGTATGLTLNGNMFGAGSSRFNNLTFTGTGSWTITNSAEVGGNFVINSGTVTAPASGLTFNLYGNYTNFGTFVHNNGTINFPNSGSFNMVGNMTGSSRFNNLNYNGSATYNFAAYPAEVFGAFNQSNGTVIAPATTLTIAGAGSGSGGYSFNHTGGSFNSNGGTVIISGASSSINAAGMTSTSSNSFNNLTFNGTTGLNTFSFIANPFLVSGNFNIIGGTVVAPSGQNIYVAGNWNNSGVFTHNSSTVNMVGVSPNTFTLSGSMTGTTNRFYNLNFANTTGGTGTATFNFLNNADVANALNLTSGSPAVINAPAIMNVLGSFSQTSSNTFVAPATALNIGSTVSGTIFNHSTGTFTPNGGTVNFVPTIATTYFITATGMNTLLTNSFNNLTINSVTGATFTINSTPVTVGGNMNILAGNLTLTGGSQLNVYGNWNNTSVATPSFTSSTSTVNMAGTIPGLTLSGAMTGTNAFYNLTFNGVGGSWSFGSNSADVASNFNITNGTVTAPSTLLQVAGSWNNFATFFNNNGTVNLNGTVNQGINGATTFNNLTLTNAAGATLNADQTVNNTLTLANGLMTLGANNLNIGPLATSIAGTFSNTAMIVATGGGQVRKQMITNGNMFYPIGDATNYTPFAINFTAGSYGAGAYVGVNETAAKQPNNANVNNYLKRYWSLRTNAISAPSYTVTQATYLPSDVVGTESLMSTGEYPLALPWLKFAPVNTTTHSLATTAVTTPGDFTGITTAPPTVSSSPNTAICFGQSTVINALGATGDPSLTYTWAPAGSLNASFGSSVVASPTVTTTYTVTVTDGNGFTNTSATTITVNPLPSPISGATTICTGTTSLMTATPTGGVWSSSNTFQALVNSSTGLVTAMAVGNPVISYTLPTGCYTTAALTINQSPLGVTGVSAVCVGFTTNLFDATAGGAWSSSNVAVGTVSTSGVVTGLSAGSTTVSYTLPVTGCYAAQVVAVNALPTAFSVTGGGSYCSGGTGVHIGLSNSQIGVNYQLMNGAVVMATEPGTNAPIDFGLITAPGTTFTVMATNATTNCTNMMTGSASVAINPLPTAITMNAGGSYCTGGAGITVSMPSSQVGVSYQLYKDGIANGAAVAGTGFPISFGVKTAGGTYTAVGTNTTTGCTNNMGGSAVVVVNPLPVVYNVIGGGGYCTGTPGVHIGLSFSDPGINYQLYYGGVPVPGSTLAGTGTALDFGLRTGLGNYTVVAANATTGCSMLMSGTAVVSLNFPPNAYAMSASGSYCNGGAGVDVRLSYSENTVNYQLYRDGVAVGSPMTGVTNFLDFGNQTIAGNYTVVATTIATGCVNTMSGTTTVSVNQLPVAFHVTGTGSYCSGTTGVNVMLDSSETGVSYSLYRTGGVLVRTLTGTGNSLNFGPQTNVSSYYVIATNATSCTRTMTDTAIVTMNTLPVAYNVTGGGSYCASGVGLHIGLNYSDIGITYQLYNGVTAVGSPIAGSNSSLDFGLQLAAGTYTVKATNNVTGCVRNMTGSPTININATPAVFTVASAASSYCAGGAGVEISLTGSESGIRYQLAFGGVSVGGPVTGTGSPITFGMHTGAGAYTVVARNTGTGCVSNMIASPVIYINALPTAYALTGGGDYCTGSTGVNVGLANSDTSVQYQLLFAGSPAGSPVTGSGTAISFGPQTGSGHYTVVATNTATTCTNRMRDSVNVNAIALPTVYTITGGGAYCAGTSGSLVGLSSSQLGVNYRLYVDSSATGSLIAGTNHPLNFGYQSVSGNYTIVATSAAASCVTNMAGSVPVTINPAPMPFTVLGGGGYCTGTTGVRDSLSGSVIGVSYQLYNGSLAVGTSMPGTGDVIDFGIQTAPGTYHVVATDAATHCTATMIHTVDVVINPLPTAYNITGGGAYCAGTPGVHVGLATGQIGTNYQLYKDGIAIDTSVAGGGVSLDFGMKTGAGVYTATATNATGCTSNMLGTVTISIMPSVMPSVTIATDNGDTICNGVSSTFTAVVVNGGTTPVYSWKVNGAFVSAAPAFTYVPADGDAVAVTVTSNANCAIPATVSSSLNMSTIGRMMPSARITANPGDSICRGTSVTYSAVPVNAGSAPVYTWYNNGAVVGSGLTYTTVPENNDVVIFMLGSNLPCRLADTVFSNDIIMSVDTLMPSVTIVSHNPIFGHVDTLVAVAHNAGSNPSYAWYVNGRQLPGQTNSTLMSNQLVTGDSVSCVVTTTSGSCAGNKGFNSVIITILSNVGVKAVTTGGSDISISPNPANGIITVKGTLASGADEAVTIEVTDMLGQVVHKEGVMAKNGVLNSRISLDKSLANGMYLINIKSSNDNTVLHLVLEQ